MGFFFWHLPSPSAEKRALDRLGSDLYETLREAAEVHRTVRKHAQSFIKPGVVLAEMCERIENMNRLLVGENGLNVRAFNPQPHPPQPPTPSSLPSAPTLSF